VTFHEEPKHAAAPEGSDSKEANPHKTKLPTIPDLRFEYSYLKSIQPFVKITRVGRKVQGMHEAEGGLVADEDTDSSREIIEIEWGRVLWVTLKDQVLSPFMQGTVWGFASLYLKPLSARLGFGGTRSIVQSPRKDGEGVSWLRRFWQRLRLQSNAQSSRST